MILCEGRSCCATATAVAGVEGLRNPLSVLVPDVGSWDLSLDACVELYN